MCAPVGNTKQLSNTFNELRFSLLLPADLPKGRYEVPIKYIRGIQHHYYNGWRGHYKMPYSQVKQLPATNTLMLSFNNTGSCRPSAQSLEINHGNLSIDSAHGNYASQAVTIYCDVPVTVKISLFSNTQPAYNNQGVAVGLGNGWDSIIYLDGVKRNEETLRWNTAGSRTVTVGSKLYGEAGKITSGALSGSMTMIMHLP
ncbi:TPA: adhesin [Escherichia coli]|nr:adhesin [Escherichia coli]